MNQQLSRKKKSTTAPVPSGDSDGDSAAVAFPPTGGCDARTFPRRRAREGAFGGLSGAFPVWMASVFSCVVLFSPDRGALQSPNRYLHALRFLGLSLGEPHLPESRLPRPRLLTAWLGVVLCVFGCAPGGAGGRSAHSSEPAAPPQARVEQPRTPPGFEPPPVEVHDWSLPTYRTLLLRPQNLVLNLPQGDVWQPLVRRGTWSGLGHAPSESEIWVRHVAARRTVSLAECENEARLSWDVLRDGAEEVQSRPLNKPDGYGGTSRVVLLETGGGRVEAFVVGVSRCLAFVYVTGDKPGFPERLRAMMNEVLPALRVPNIGERGVLKPT